MPMLRLLAFAILLSGCSSAPKVASPPRSGSSTFVYEIRPGQAERSLGIHVAILEPEVAKVSPRLSDPKYMGRSFVRLETEPEVDSRIDSLISDFKESWTRDAGLLLAAKGIGLTGSYVALSSMTELDKRKATLALSTRISLYIDKEVSRQPESGSPVNGIAEVVAQCDLTLLEPLSGEKLWTKHLALPPLQVPYTLRRTRAGLFSSRIDDARAQAVGEAFLPIYKHLLDRFWMSIAPFEWASLESGSRDLKQKAAPAVPATSLKAPPPLPLEELRDGEQPKPKRRPRRIRKRK